MNKTEEVIGHLLSNSQHISALVTDDTGVWETHNKLVEHIRELDRKAEAFDEIKDYLSRPSPIDENRDEVQKIIDEYDKEANK